VRYRYYISLPLLQGKPESAGSIHRVPATDIERVVAEAISKEIPDSLAGSHRELIKIHVNRVEVQPGQLAIEIRASAEVDASEDANRRIIQVPWQKPPSKRRREIVVPKSGLSDEASRPIRADARARLVAAIAQGRLWLSELIVGTVPNIEAIAARERCSLRKINMTISLAFLAPTIVKAAIEGRLPRGMGFSRLCDQPAEWSAQYRALGLAQR
jgi:hypothetical protein